MSIVLSDHFNNINDNRIDVTNDTVDISTEGLRSVNYILRDLRSRHFWPWTIKETLLKYYVNIREYTANSNWEELVGLYEQDNFRDPFRRISPIEFDRRLNQDANEDLIATKRNSRDTTIKVNFVNTKSDFVTIDTNSSYDGNGEWVGTGTADNVATDTVVYFENAGSIRFDLTGTGTGILTNSTITSVDLSALGLDYKNFMKFYVPSATALTSWTLKWGNSASVYHEVTVTTQADGRTFQDGLNIIGFDLVDSTDTGTVDDSVIDYIILECVASAAISNVHISELSAVSPDPMVLKYYTTDWTYDDSAASWYPQFQNADDINNDYGAWSGEYEDAANLIDIGSSWRVLDLMEETKRAEVFRKMYEGPGGETGMIKRFMKKYPSQVKKVSPPSIVLSTRSDSDYWA